jgi:hypothetical protein
VPGLLRDEPLGVVELDRVRDIGRRQCRSSSAGSPAALPAPVNASSIARTEIRLARSLIQCSSTPVIHSISGTVSTIRRRGGLPLHALPHRANSPPHRPYRGAFGLCRR